MRPDAGRAANMLGFGTGVHYILMTSFLQFYGSRGDANGNDGARSVVREASLSIARPCFGDRVIHGHGSPVVTYVAFKGNKTALGKDGAAWLAKSSEELQNDPKFNKLEDELLREVHV